MGVFLFLVAMAIGSYLFFRGARTFYAYSKFLRDSENPGNMKFRSVRPRVHACAKLLSPVVAAGLFFNSVVLAFYFFHFLHRWATET